MKKLALTMLSLILLVGCSNTNQNITKEFFVGEWSCATKYKDMYAGTVDLITFNANGTMTDDNFIFDHTLTTMIENKIQDYFSSPLKYLEISTGIWRFENNHLIYKLKRQDFKRIIFHDVLKDIQSYDKFNKLEAKLFNLYSTSSDEEIKLKFEKLTKDGFEVSQTLGDTTYKSICQSKAKAGFHLNERLEAYKKIHQGK